ncbi:MAG: hypothetical protein GWN07_16555, partial [Actinobacteria bacterium]|nr:hypothetical protein [Actinomycetota bacterium]NIS32007.1 hypothetical protein [Actinomycetota bacterium]NIU67079.1 hypothetical protein [Actinomycetota bacterium]NIV87640.1 hypothetical protein [Actinomycetota bacterium]NIW28874.1 hypothetical protein [Actinomycetota bacterium]
MPAPPQVLFSMNDYLPPNPYQATYDVAGDRGRFVMSRRVGAGGGDGMEELIVIEHFHDHLRATV